MRLPQRSECTNLPFRARRNYKERMVNPRKNSRRKAHVSTQICGHAGCAPQYAVPGVGSRAAHTQAQESCAGTMSGNNSQ